MPLRSLMAGGAGFIGSHLCRRLIDRGDEVVCLDNLSTGRHRNVAEHLADITLASKLLGWRPIVPIEEGLMRTAAYLRARMATDGRIDGITPEL